MGHDRRRAAAGRQAGREVSAVPFYDEKLISNHISHHRETDRQRTFYTILVVPPPKKMAFTTQSLPTCQSVCPQVFLLHLIL